MSSNSRISQLREMIVLEEKRSNLQQQLSAIDSKLAEYQRLLYGSAGRRAAASKAPKPAPVSRRGERRGALRERILEALEAAGAKGVTVRELASVLNIKPANVHSWFSINAKKIGGLKKIGEAHYALNGSAAPAQKAAPARKGRAAREAKKETKAAKPAKAQKAPKAPKARKAPAPAAKAPKAAKLARAKGAKRGELKEAILQELKKAGAEGVAIKDLSNKLGVKYKNLYIWFVTTGKRTPGVEKAGPARYRLAA